MDLMYWSVCSSSRRGGDLIKGVDGGHHFIRVYKNVVQHPNNDISILPGFFQVWY